MFNAPLVFFSLLDCPISIRYFETLKILLWFSNTGSSCTTDGSRGLDVPPIRSLRYYLHNTVQTTSIYLLPTTTFADPSHWLSVSSTWSIISLSFDKQYNRIADSQKFTELKYDVLYHYRWRKIQVHRKRALGSLRLVPSTSAIISIPALAPFEDPRSPPELFWVKHQPYLQNIGYMLLPRYHSDRRPSWIKKDGTNLKEKYSWAKYISHLDVIRMEDGVKVALRSSQELAMTMHLSLPKLRSDPRNHTVPVLGTIPIPGEETERVFVVLPVLRWFHTPYFHCRREFADAFRKILEVVDWRSISKTTVLSSHSRDACTLNFLMDATNLYPKGFHMAYQTSIDGVRHTLHARPRCLVAPVKYYIIDFETTRHFPEGKDSARAIKLKCQIKTLPEFLGAPAPYNPFRLDVYNVSATFLEFCEQYAGLDEFKPLCLQMMAKDPTKPPTTPEMLVKFDAFIGLNYEIWMRSHIWLDYSWHKPPSRFIQFLWPKFPSLLPYF
ncbi:uncharacterized protein EV420DRAFT_1311673 [Desarmillaria tabescens]|uniref:Uncharacterized protein n=1 Tax=Armillaria tabescens TaxID=1929756 RepID=A0AA39MZP8_ARMTA|nr:uncharacterized protein EV420DRAFT_1311673 [Desarmillaria tabescens]KAK0452118.1 hypothetical protein EV420DRAFT_1311673 [Desarmillaria tabescens]